MKRAIRFALVCTGLILTAGLGTAFAGEPINGPTVCRGPGFWATHSGSEKNGENLAQELIDSVGCLEVCGEVIDSTGTNDADSAIEGLCGSPKAGGQVQLARQLLTSALNCIFSTGAPGCDPEWSACNDACIANDPVLGATCRSYFSCVNDGGIYDSETGACQIGTCELIAEGNGALPCGPGYDACPLDTECVPTIGCDDAELVSEGFDFTGYAPQASSSKKCHVATRTRCAIVGVNEAECATGNESTEPELCDPV